MGIWLLWIEFPNIEHGILSTGDKPTVIFQPAYSLHWLSVSSEFELGRDLSSVELIDPDVFVVLTSKKMATIREYDLSALFDWNTLVWLQPLVKNVEEFDLVTETDDKV